MGGRGASLRNRNNSISKVRKGLGYVGKISTSNRAGLAEIQNGKRVSFKLGEARLNYGTVSSRLTRSKVKINGNKLAKDPRFQSTALSFHKNDLARYAQRTGDSTSNLKRIRDRSVRIANANSPTPAQYKAQNIKKLEAKANSYLSRFGSNDATYKHVKSQISYAKQSKTGATNSGEERANLARFAKNGGRWDKYE